MSALLSFLDKNSGTILALIGLMWAIGTFWWMNWRKGRIITSIPRTYAAVSQGMSEMLLVRLPLVFYNTGAATIIIQNLRLTLEQNKRKSAILYFNRTASELNASAETEWARPFPVEGRKACSVICEFLRKPGRFVFSKGGCNALLEGKFDSDKKWRMVSNFKLRTPSAYLKTLNSQTLIPYDNDPDREDIEEIQSQ
jgi:hypothetical protein